MSITVQKMRAYVPMSVELLFDSAGPRQGLALAPGVWLYEPWPAWLTKEWLRRGHGLGRTAVSCRWPRPMRAQLRQERIDRNEWLKSLDEDE